MSDRVRIITDSVADLPPEIARRLGIAVVPVQIFSGGQNHRDDETLDCDRFYESLQQDGPLPQTSALSDDEILHFYQTLAAEGAEEIIALFMAASLSSLGQYAQMAAARLEGVRVHILETGQVSMGIGWLAIAAAEAAAAGATVEEIAALVAGLRRRTSVVGVLASLRHLRRSGRVGWARARAGDLLQVKPLIIFNEGEARLLGQVRTYSRALQWLEHWIAETAPLERLALLHSRPAPQVLERVHAALQPYAPAGELLVVEAGPTFVTHVGPGGVGVAVVQAVKPGRN